MKRVHLLVAVCVLLSSVVLDAQRGGRGRAGGPALSPRQAAPIDLTGYWVSPIIEDWKYRMVTPSKGVFDAVPLNAEGRKVGEGWDPARDEASGEQCRGYGAGGIMRLPGRLRISWQDDATLKVETDTGTQTRLLRFGNPPAPAEATWQGHSLAQWKHRWAQPQGRHDKPATRVRAQERRAVQRSSRGHGVLGPEHDAERRSVADGHRQGRGSAVLHPVVYHELGLQEAPRRPRLESHALLRTMNKGRLEAFSDGVIAIIITIMVLELRVQHGAEWGVLRPLMPVFLSYVLSFVYVGIYWNNHHHLLHATRQISGGVMWSNMHLLFWLSLFPFVTGWMGENDFARNPVALYGVVQLMAAVAYTILVRALLKHHEPDSALARAIGSDAKGTISLVLYVLGILSSFVHTAVSLLFYVVVAVIWLVPDRRIERALKQS